MGEAQHEVLLQFQFLGTGKGTEWQTVADFCLPENFMNLLLIQDVASPRLGRAKYLTK